MHYAINHMCFFSFNLNNLSELLVKLQPACDTINLQQNLFHKLFNSVTEVRGEISPGAGD